MEYFTNSLVLFLENHYQLAVLFVIILSTVIAIIGILPSYFVTMASIIVFGPFIGFIISVVGEAIGGIISFIIYRKGFKSISQGLLEKNPKIERIINTEGKEARRLIFSFRLFPYMPSGLVTYAGAIGKVSLWDFTIASTLGKIPALFFEVLISIGVLKTLQLPLNQIILIISILLIFYSLYRVLKSK